MLSTEQSFVQRNVGVIFSTFKGGGVGEICRLRSLELSRVPFGILTKSSELVPVRDYRKFWTTLTKIIRVFFFQ